MVIIKYKNKWAKFLVIFLALLLVLCSIQLVWIAVSVNHKQKTIAEPTINELPKNITLNSTIKQVSTAEQVLYDYNLEFDYNFIENTSKINSSTIIQILVKTINDTARANASWRILDTNYTTIDIEQFKNIFFKKDAFKRDRTVADYSDCDDYAFKVYGLFCLYNLSSLSCGVFIWTDPPHAEPFFIDSKHDVYIIRGSSHIELLKNLDRKKLNLILI
ncbi:MAG: hypothetical protein IMZ52_10410 [Actinobacteria bacterium]|nr:hypothetical protein [Bacteroidota bacterium]MBE3095432.1 hypothetical protein [Actinomycetota bacterium]